MGNVGRWLARGRCDVAGGSETLTAGPPHMGNSAQQIIMKSAGGTMRERVDAVQWETADEHSLHRPVQSHWMAVSVTAVPWQADEPREKWRAKRSADRDAPISLHE